MGQYSATQNFYKPSSEELVDVESQINYNLRRADERVRQLVEWQYIPSSYQNVQDAYPEREIGMKYYKASTNCPQYTTLSSGSLTLAQDSNSRVYSWTQSGLSFLNNYTSENNAEQRISYRLDPVTNTVHWRGGLVLKTSMDQIPLNTNIQVITLPTVIRPTRSKYAFVHMGIASSGYSVCRILFTSAGIVEINRMGIDQTDSSQRAVSFCDVSYPIGDT